MGKVRRNQYHLGRRVIRGVESVLIPNSRNNYQPFLIRRYGLLAVVILVLIIQVFFFTIRDGHILGDNPSITSSQLLAQTNAERSRNGLTALKLNDELTAAAHAKARNMLDVGYWAHNAPDGTTPWQWMIDAGYDHVDAGENLARGFNTTASIIEAWMDSPEHRANILHASFTDVGFAAIDGTMDGHDVTLVVALYGRPANLPPATGDDTNSGVAAIEGHVSLWVHLRRGIQQLMPSLLVILTLLGLVTFVAILTHIYQHKLPQTLHWSWHRYRAIYKVIIMIFIALCAVLSYGYGAI
ncbi:CAP domain-containing protein [Candidatus Saccharibacteria bacterium]|nr:CAP domain-containing protein [Candidatus Saccharibacteria bacterium]